MLNWVEDGRWGEKRSLPEGGMQIIIGWHFNLLTSGKLFALHCVAALATCQPCQLLQLLSTTLFVVVVVISVTCKVKGYIAFDILHVTEKEGLVE